MTKLSYTIPEAAEATGYSETTIKLAIDRNEIAKKYANRKPVILAAELLRWLESLPDVSPLERSKEMAR